MRGEACVTVLLLPLQKANRHLSPWLSELVRLVFAEKNRLPAVALMKRSARSRFGSFIESIRSKPVYHDV